MNGNIFIYLKNNLKVRQELYVRNESLNRSLQACSNSHTTPGGFTARAQYRFTQRGHGSVSSSFMLWKQLQHR